MTTDEKLWEVCMEIYRELYKKAKPPANFDKLMKKGITKKREWFMKYYLPQEEEIKIIDRICEKHKIKGWKKRKINQEICLGCSPNSCERTWREELKK